MCVEQNGTDRSQCRCFLLCDHESVHLPGINFREIARLSFAPILGFQCCGKEVGFRLQVHDFELEPKELITEALAKFLEAWCAHDFFDFLPRTRAALRAFQSILPSLLRSAHLTA